MQQVRLIGFTGTIASGKTARCHHLVQCALNRQRAPQEVLLTRGEAVAVATAHDSSSGCCSTGVSHSVPRVGVKYINADLVGHNIYVPGTPCYYELLDRFGKDILEESKPSATDNAVSTEPFINRRALGAIVFSDPDKLQLLNSVCWPHISTAIAAERQRFITEARQQQQPVLLLVLEAALLVEMDSSLALCTDTWFTHCTAEEAVTRVMARDGLPEADARRRVASQTTLEGKLTKLKEGGFTGGIETFDTTNISCEEGLMQLERVFDTYWNTRIASFL